MKVCKHEYYSCDSNINKISIEICELKEKILYRENFGSLIYAMTTTRQQLSFIATNVSIYELTFRVKYDVSEA